MTNDTPIIGEILSEVKPKRLFYVNLYRLNDLAALDDIHVCDVMIYQACGLDKKQKDELTLVLLLLVEHRGLGLAAEKSRENFDFSPRLGQSRL